LAVLVLILFLTCIINLYFFSSRGRFTAALKKNLLFDISYRRLFYVFPNKFIVKGISVEDEYKRDLLVSERASVDTAVANFSLLKLLTEGEVVISSVNIYSTDINYNFLAKNFEKIRDFVLDMPQHDIILRFRDTVLDMTSKNDKFLNYVSTDFDLMLKRGRFFLKGQMRRYLYTAKGSIPYEEGKEPLNYELLFKILPEEIAIERIFLSGEKVYTQTWGKIRDG